MSETNQLQLCDRCGAVLSGYGADRLCAACLLESALLEPNVPAGARASAAPLLAFNDYELLEEIARGGMGVVYRARQISLNRPVAIKLMLGGHLANAADMKRFRTEAEIAAQLQHPNIVAIHEVGDHEGQPFFSMDLVEGRNLGQLVRDEPLPSGKTAAYLKTIAEAVQYAHSRGVLHRDLKPSNILIDENDQPRITDFGLAKRLNDSQLSTPDPQLTLTGQVLGSPSFIPPEQAAGRKDAIGPASDVYSLGAILYQLLTGRPPFVAETMTQTLRMVAEQEPVPPRLLNVSVPRDLETICLKCLDKDPTRRYETAKNLAADIVRHLNNEPIVARPPSNFYRIQRLVRRNKLLFAAVSAVALTLIAGLTFSTFSFLRERKAHAGEAAQRRIAVEKRTEAETARGSEAQQRGNAERLLYVANMNLAQQAWEQNNISRLRQLLSDTQAYKDRGFEWYYWQRQDHLALKTLRGHSARVTSVAFSPDGRRIVTASVDQTAKVWEAASGRELLTLKGHAGGVRSVAFFSDGQRIVTGSIDQKAKLWDAASGREILTLKGHSAPINSVASSLDGERVVTGSGDRTAKVWEAASGRELLTLKGHSAPINSVAFSPDSQRIATGSQDGTARVWEAASGQELLTLKGHAGVVVSVAFSPDGRQIITGSEDQTAKLWDAASGRELLTLKGHSGWIWSAVFSPDGQRIATGSSDETAKVWEPASICEPLLFQGHSNRINSAAFSPGGRRIVTASEDRTAKVWEVANGREVLTLNGHSAQVMSAVFSPDGQRIVTGSVDQTAKVWEAASGHELLTLEGHSAPIWCVSASPDGQRIVTGSQDSTVKLWEAVSGRQLLTLKGHRAPIWSVAFSPDGQRIVTGSVDQTIKVWEAASGHELLTLEGHRAPIWSAAFSPDGERILSGSSDQTAKVWEAASGREMLTLKGHSAAIKSVAFSPDGQRIITGSEDQTIKVWEAASGREVLTLKANGAAINSVAFSPDGQRIVTGSEDRTARMWQAARSEEVAAWRAEENVAAQRFVALERERIAEQESQRLARAHDEGAIKRWLILAPIALATGQGGPEGLDAEQIQGEGRLKPKAGEKVVMVSGELKWQEVAQEDSVIDFNVILGRQTWRSVAYAVCYVYSETEQRGLQMLVGSDDGAKVYLNGKQIYDYFFPHPFILDQDTVQDIEFNAGLNVLVFKVANEYENWQGSIRLTDAQGNPVKRIKVTLDPEGNDLR
jgi:WD40 repeat protein/serine/threonine protein kinase